MPNTVQKKPAPLRETWTFQPAEDVRQAVELEFGDIRAQRGQLSTLCNDAIRNYLPEAMLKIETEIRRAEIERHQRALDKLANSKLPSSGVGKLISRAEKAADAPQSRRRKP
jgi:hypothetical protein